nr:hypothetical protein MACL_00003482 [Theileria orientalis]
MQNKIRSAVPIVLPLLLQTLARLVILATLASIITSSAKVMANTKKGLAKRRGCKVEDTDVFNSYRLSQLIDDIMDILIVENKKNIDNTRLEIGNAKDNEAQVKTSARSNGNSEPKGRKKMKSGSRRGYSNTNGKGYKNISKSSIRRSSKDEKGISDEKETNGVEESIVSIYIVNEYNDSGYGNNSNANSGNESASYPKDENGNDSDDDTGINNKNDTGDDDGNTEIISSGSEYDSESRSGTDTDDIGAVTTMAMAMAITDTPTTISTAVTSSTNTSISTANTSISTVNSNISTTNTSISTTSSSIGTTNTTVRTIQSICDSDYSSYSNNAAASDKGKSGVKSDTTAIVESKGHVAIKKFRRKGGMKEDYDEEEEEDEDVVTSISVVDKRRNGKKELKQLISDMIHIVRGDENFRVKEIEDNLKFINYFNQKIPDEIKLNNQKLEQCRHKLAVNERNIIHGRPSMTNQQLNKVKEKMEMLREENEALKRGSERLKRIEKDLRERMRRIKAYLRVFEGSQGFILGKQ